jgi:D-glycero-alpha-D-manno-heptose-7-phosphate kinase
MKRVIATASTRVDLAGGTLDLWPIHQLLPEKATVNFSVSIPAVAEVSAADQCELVSEDQNLHLRGSFEQLIEDRQLPLLAGLLKEFWGLHLPPVSIRTRAKSPAGAGLGGSSCLAMATAKALVELRVLCGDTQIAWEESNIVERVRDIEAVVIQAPTGIQDYWGGIRGGLSIIEYPPGQPRVTTIRSRIYQELSDAALLVYCGKSRASAMNNLAIFQAFLSGDVTVVEHLRSIGQLSKIAAGAALVGDFHGLIGASRTEWDIRRELWPGVVTEETNAIDQAAMNAGAYFSRVCGAGGGGVVAVFCPTELKPSIAEACSRAGGQVLPMGTVASPLSCKNA